MVRHQNCISNFNITLKRGFQIKFENGYVLSVQFGPGNYCDHYDSVWDEPDNVEIWSSDNAEIAILDPHREFHRCYKACDDVLPNQNINDFIDWVTYTSNL